MWVSIVIHKTLLKYHLSDVASLQVAMPSVVMLYFFLLPLGKRKIQLQCKPFLKMIPLGMTRLHDTQTQNTSVYFWAGRTDEEMGSSGGHSPLILY